jgi:hypothetical protein
MEMKLATTADVERSVTRVLASISAYPDIKARAEMEAKRLIFRLDLRHPVSIPAALRIVSENTAIAEFKLLTAIAHEVVTQLVKRK